MINEPFPNNMPARPVMLSTRIDRLVPPPRKVPPATFCSAFSSIFVMIGGIFFSFGMISVWAFSWNIHPIDEWRLTRSYASAPAVVETVSQTSGTVNEENVYKYRFRFNPGDGLPVYAHCYTTGQNWSEGERVETHYLVDNPDVACLEGARLSQFPAWLILLVMIFPIIGLAIFIPGVISGWRKIKLLRLGEVARGINVSFTTTNTKVNNIPVLRYAFQFFDRLGFEYRGFSKSLPTDKIGDEASEPVLYLAADPRQSMLVDTLPLKFPLEVDEEGQWRHRRGFLKPVLMFILIWCFVLVHAVIAVLKIMEIW